MVALAVALTLLVIALTMAAKDILGTTLVAAIECGRHRLGGMMDALGDAAAMLGLVLGVDSISLGLNLHNLRLLLLPRTLLVLAVQMATSYSVTSRMIQRTAKMRKETPDADPQ
jgi:hypothetical protein